MNEKNKKMFSLLSDIELLALCIYGESRGEPYAGKCGVAWVVLNRVKRHPRYGAGIKGVILKPYQFSCFLEADPNFKKLLDCAINPYLIDEKYLEIADGCIDEYIPSPVENATHYYSDTMKKPPYWIGKMTFITKIGHHSFFLEP